MMRALIGSIIALAAAGAVIPTYFLSGFTHVLPDGLDHVLFILGLFFLSRSFPLLLLQMTLFTVAHSLTLGLSLYGVISLPVEWIEVAIALSITFVAVENLYAGNRLRAWRPWVVFASGLVHGMGFAHSFAETPIPREDFLPALFSFNLGVEFGQLAVLGLAYAAVALIWNRAWYRNAVERPICVLMALVGLGMAALRLG
ncbi:HupE/UreJ family protein [Luteolibacter sp. SL250]|uniref:HupE/UreJ family protein n=1 Tax=Luteolibacter sp. SL250 TaxID=2995170 RepID=UPI002271ADCD|nr:HupE/UreJ family protein [Luteolibacter sp. SL250]WAC18090.1 HupE/UreJ family protein [Luteolibacter sp. SL250]